MSGNDVLTQDEIDALLNGVSTGDVETEEEIPEAEGPVSSYDFTSQDRIVRGRLPTLEIINERLARYLRLHVYEMIRHTTEVSVGNVQMLKFAEYIHSLFVPASLNLIKVNPLRGTGLIVFDPKLVFAVVDNFFGGDGRFHAKVEGRDFTLTEQRIIQRMLEISIEGLHESWKTVKEIDIEVLSSEVNPTFANIVTPSEVVVVASFHIEVDGGGGDMHVVLPYAMVEPIRDILEAGVQSDRSDIDERWLISMRDCLMDADVSLSSTLARTELSIREVNELKVGDIIPIDYPNEVVAEVEGVGLFRGGFGVSGGKNSIRIYGPMKATKQPLMLPAPPVDSVA